VRRTGWDIDTRTYQAADIHELVSCFDVLGIAEEDGDARRQDCPSCGRGRDIFSVSTDKFYCFRCEAKGDAIDLYRLVTGMEGARFPDVLAAMARDFGVEPGSVTPDELERRKAEREERRAAEEAKKRRQQEIQIALVPTAWNLLPTRSWPGEEYLKRRRLGALVGRDDVVRFDEQGNLQVLLRDYTGQPVNVQTRFIAAGATPKTMNRKGCPKNGTSFGDVSRIATTSGSVLMVEGLADYLTAVVMFEPLGNAVIGAPGVSEIAPIVEAAAPRVAELGRSFCYVVHEDADGTGDAGVEEAIEIALDAGVPFDPEVDLFNLGGAADLNDAWCRDKGDCRDYE